MEANEAHELHEHAEHGAYDTSMRPVAFTMSMLAVLVAIATVLGHRTHTEAVLNQNKATDQWNEYQAKKIRSYNTSLESQLLAVVSVADKAKAAEALRQNAEHQAKWDEDLKGLQEEARQLEAEVRLDEAKAGRFDLGEALLEIGLVVTSVTLLTRRYAYWYMGMVFGAAGVVSAALAFAVR
ncbi:MAG TPA: DUF4337 domain-containing protein [Candidatus Saccharimonadales bacterium]|nr:DUF4337 domain-containing protein [Candidatus Saccharimonadales bacterium]